MARGTRLSYGKVYAAFWTDEKVEAFPDDAKLLALYFITGPHRNMIGCSRVPVGYIVADLKWTQERTTEALKKLSESGFIVRDSAGWTHIVNQLEYDPLASPNHGKGAVKLLAEIPRTSPAYSSLAPRLASALEALGKDFGSTVEDLRKVLVTPGPAPGPVPSVPTERAPAAPANPSDLKAMIFGPCLSWLSIATAKDPAKVRPMIGKWCKDHGDGAVLEAFMAGQREAPVEPVAWITAALKARKSNGKRDDTSARRTALAGAFADLAPGSSKGPGVDQSQDAGGDARGNAGAVAPATEFRRDGEVLPGGPGGRSGGPRSQGPEANPPIIEILSEASGDPRTDSRRADTAAAGAMGDRTEGPKLEAVSASGYRTGPGESAADIPASPASREDVGAPRGRLTYDRDRELAETISGMQALRAPPLNPGEAA